MGLIETLRQFKIGEYAVFDFVASFLGIYLLAPMLSKLALKVGLIIPLSSWLYFTVPIGILTHLAVGNMTPMTQDLLDPKGHYLLKILIVSLIVLGIRGISKTN